MRTYLFFALLFLVSCKSNTPLVAAKHDYPNPVDTTTKNIQLQKRQVFETQGLQASNDFPAARLNAFSQENDSTYIAAIWPENFPINPSPWYAFKLWAKEAKEIYLKLQYSNGAQHRYHPKLSLDGETWKLLDTTAIRTNTDQMSATLKLQVSTDTLWLAAQEIQDHRRVGEWAKKMSATKNVTLSNAGKSAQGRALYHLNITENTSTNKPTVLIISRQHPPEVTGFLCMKAFVETIINEGATNGFLNKYRVMVYPLMNPDGVDLGHYRHNTGGVDLNRDWSQYHQPEIKQVTNHMVRETTQHNNEVLLGLDFHSTYRDVYYTPDESVTRKIPNFKNAWLDQIKVALNIEDINERPGKISRPTSSGWFNKQFGATGITYEIGDDTPRDFIKTKGVESARAMMKILLEE